MNKPKPQEWLPSLSLVTFVQDFDTDNQPQFCSQDFHDLTRTSSQDLPSRDLQDLYSQDNQDCDSSTFQLRVQDNQEFSGTLLQDLCGTQNYTGTFSQDSCGRDACEFNSKPEETNRAQGATCGLVEPSTVADFTSSSVPFPDTGDLLAQGCRQS